MLYIFDRDSYEHTNWDLNHRQIGDIIGFTDENTWFKLIEGTVDNIHYDDSINITEPVNNWLKEHNIRYPFTNKEDEILFRLTFG